MYIYSGKCRLGTVGDNTPFKDMAGRPLFVGDIVSVFHDGHLCDGITAVVSEEFTSYSDGTHKVNEGPIDTFIMGIRSVSLDEEKAWQVLKIKDHTDVISGERWPAYGFSYSDA